MGGDVGVKKDGIQVMSGDQDVASCRGVWVSPAGMAVLVLASLVSGGAALLAVMWSPRLRYRLLYTDAKSLEDAPYFLFTLSDGRSAMAPVELPPLPAGAGPPLRIATVRQTRHVLQRSSSAATTAAASPLPEGPCAAFVRVPAAAPEVAVGLPRAAAALREDPAAVPPPFLDGADARAEAAALYGPNVMVVPVTPLWRTLATNLLHPFCLFQAASCVIWIVEEYYSYSAIIAVITLCTTIATSVGDWRNARRLAGLAQFTCPVKVIRDGGLVTIDSSEMVPGDVVAVTPGRLPADMLLLSGEAVVDEAMLTGESIAVRKTPLGRLGFTPALAAPTAPVGTSVKAPASLRSETPDGLPSPRRPAAPAASGKTDGGVVMAASDAAAAASEALGRLMAQQPQSVLYGDTVVRLAVAPHSGPLSPTRNPSGLQQSKDHLHPAAPLAVVVSTGFNTAKGAMLRAMLYPPRHRLRFARDALWFILAMLFVAMCFFGWTAVLLARMGSQPTMIFQKFLDMITVAVPPALVACLAIATAAAAARLSRAGVGVSSSAHINAAGLVDTVAFDKTGTLTREGLELKELRIATGGRFLPGSVPRAALAPPPTSPPADGEKGGEGAGDDGSSSSVQGQHDQPAVPVPPHVRALLACCHGLALVDGAVVGDPLEIELFVATGWRCLGEGAASPNDRSAVQNSSSSGMVVESPDGSERATVVWRADFTSGRQRSSVVAADASGALMLYVKGSPEAIRDLCTSGIPPNFDAQLQAATQAGLRTLALAHRRLPPSTSLRALAAADPATIECGLEFDGFALLENPLRPDSAGVIASLKGAGMQVLMASGDHARTAVHVACQCGILDAWRPVALLSTATPAGCNTTDKRGTDTEGPSGWESALECELLDPEAGSGGGRVAVVAHALEGVAAGRLQCALTGPALRVLREAAAATFQRAAPSPAGAAASGAEGRKNVAGAAGVEGRVALELVRRSGSSGEDGEPTATVVIDDGSGDGEGAEDTGGERPPGDVVNSSGGEDPAVCALRSVLMRCAVYARMAPGDKALLMELLGQGEAGTAGAPPIPGLGRHVAFCGDGANDTGALRAALVGVSLCEAEASVAAPMTAKTPSAGAVITVIAEGRCSLAAAYAIFRFITAYALIQVFGVCLVYASGLVIGNYQYLIQDLFYATVTAAAMGATQPTKRLAALQPPAGLMSAAVMAPVAANVIVTGVFQVAALALLHRERWFSPFDTAAHGVLEDSRAPEVSVVFLVTTAQIWISALALNTGAPFRAPVWSNSSLVAVLGAQLAFLLYCLLSPVTYPGRPSDPIITHFVELVPLPLPFRAKLLALLCANAAAAFALQHISVAAAPLIARVAAAVARRLLAGRSVNTAAAHGKL